MKDLAGDVGIIRSRPVPCHDDRRQSSP
jgi:hypothetical protein